MSESVREVLLNQRGEPAGPDVVLAEVMALRSIVLNLATAQARGEAVGEDRIRELIATPTRSASAAPTRNG